MRWGHITSTPFFLGTAAYNMAAQQVCDTHRPVQCSFSQCPCITWGNIYIIDFVSSFTNVLNIAQRSTTTNLEEDPFLLYGSSFHGDLLASDVAL